MNLYPSIPHELGLKSIDYWISEFPDELNAKFNKNFVMKAIDFILNNNIFIFNDVYYKQIKGTAIGPSFAPTYANLTVGFLEIKLYNIIECNFSINMKDFIMNLWKRYIDDCFIIWSHTLDLLI